MPNGLGFTPADIANDNAQTARNEARSNATRMDRLVNLLVAKGVITNEDVEREGF